MPNSACARSRSAAAAFSSDGNTCSSSTRAVASFSQVTSSAAWAESLAKRSPVAVQIAKKGYYAAEDMNYDKQFEYMNEAFARLCTTEDAKEGVSAFFEKRKPEWKGC